MTLSGSRTCRLGPYGPCPASSSTAVYAANVRRMMASRIGSRPPRAILKWSRAHRESLSAVERL
eukprot:7216222-Alexandrium_andersonii.AAC.1